MGEVISDQMISLHFLPLIIVEKPQIKAKNSPQEDSQACWQSQSLAGRR